jgi:uncharacterized SAM-binding protein YcdF (DUF218 family)
LKRFTAKKNPKMGSFFFKVLLPIISLLGFSDKKCKVYYQQAQETTFDAIIVPGVPFEGQKWDTLMKGRVYWAKHFYDSGIAKHIIFSGSSVYSPYYEGKIMALYAKEIGIPDSVIFTEIKAEHTTENVYYSYQKSKNLGFKKIAFATDPFQCKMMVKFIEQEKLDIALIPFVKEILKKENKTNPEIPYQLAFNPNFVSIKDRESKKMRRNGTRGKNINRSYYEDGKLE